MIEMDCYKCVLKGHYSNKFTSKIDLNREPTTVENFFVTKRYKVTFKFLFVRGSYPQVDYANHKVVYSGDNIFEAEYE